MADSSLIEWVELQARGITDVQQQIEQLDKATQHAADSQIVLAKAQLDPRFRESAARLERAKSANNELIRQGREQLRIDEARARLVNRYGSVIGGGLYGFNQFRSSPLGGAIGRGSLALGAGITAGAMSGLSGTVEGNKLANEFKLINRELAGAFLPAVQAATGALRFLRKGLQSLGGGSQNALMAGGLAATGYGAYKAYGIGSQILAHAGGQAAGNAIGGGGGAAARGAGSKASMLGGMGAAGPIAFMAAATAYSVQGRKSQNSMLESLGIGKKTANFINDATVGPGGKYLGGDYGVGFGGGAHRRPTIADAGLDSVGSGYERVGQALALQSGQDSTTANTDAIVDNSSILAKLIDVLSKPGVASWLGVD